MADKTIGSLTQATNLTDDSSFVCEDSGEAKRVTGKQFKDFAKQGVSDYVEAAQTAASEAQKAVSAVGTLVQDANDAADRAEAAVVKSPKIQNGTWWVYNQSAGSYQDSGVAATGPMGGITKIERISGTGMAGSLDTYKVTCSDGSTFTFTVQNGANGSGAGDMMASVYDPTGKAQDIFTYCQEQIQAAIGTAIGGSY